MIETPVTVCGLPSSALTHSPSGLRAPPTVQAVCLTPSNAFAGLSRVGDRRAPQQARAREGRPGITPSLDEERWPVDQPGRRRRCPVDLIDLDGAELALPSEIRPDITRALCVLSGTPEGRGEP